MIFNIGPFQLYRVEDTGALCVSLLCMDDWACGWEYGWRDPLRGVDEPIMEMRIGKLMVAYLNVWKGGCEIWLLGFWAMPSWGRGRKI